jgi:O-antigen/teichoic acid export membrane protein
MPERSTSTPEPRTASIDGAASESASARTRAVKRAFVSGAGAKVVSVLCGFLAIGIAVRAQGDESYGVVAVLVGIVGAVGFLDFGIGNLAIGMVARSHAKHDVQTLGQEVASTLVFLIGMGFLAALILIPIALTVPLDGLFNAPHQSTGILTTSAAIFAVVTAIAIPGSLGSKIALGLQQGAQNNVVLALSSASVTGAVAIAAVAGAPLPVYVALFVGLPVLWNVAQTVVNLRTNRLGIRFRFRSAKLGTVVRLLPGGLPFAVLGIAAAVSYQTDAFVVSAVLGAAAATAYALPLRLFNGVPTVFSSGLQQLWASTAHALEEGDLAWVRRNFLRTLAVTMLVFGALVVVLILAGPFLLDVWAGGQVKVGIPALVVFGAWTVYSFFMSQLSMLLNGAGKVGAQAIAAVLMAVTNLPVSIALTHSVGLTGPLLGSLITHAVFVGVPTAWMSVRLLRGDYERRAPAASTTGATVDA